MNIKAYDLCNASLVLSWAQTHPLLHAKWLIGRRQIPVTWYGPVNILSVQIDVAYWSSNGTINRVPKHEHHTLKGDLVSPPANNSDINTRALLFEFVSKLCEQCQHKVRVQLSQSIPEKMSTARCYSPVLMSGWTSMRKR
jgi:hypothetical protein